MLACQGCDDAAHLAMIRPFEPGSEIHLAVHELHVAIERLTEALGDSASAPPVSVDLTRLVDGGAL